MTSLRYQIVPELTDGNKRIVLHEFNNLHDIMSDKIKEFQQTIVDTREKAIRDALVALGWTPPKETP